MNFENDFASIRARIRAVWKGAIGDAASTEAWYQSLRKYSYDQIRKAVDDYIKVGRFEPKPADIIAMIPAAKRTNEPFNKEQQFVFINGKKCRAYNCQRCMDLGMITWEDKDGNTYGVPCDCPAGHFYFKWGWLTIDEQTKYINEHGYHGERVGENWYEMQSGIKTK